MPSLIDTLTMQANALEARMQHHATHALACDHLTTAALTYAAAGCFTLTYTTKEAIEAALGLDLSLVLNDPEQDYVYSSLALSGEVDGGYVVAVYNKDSTKYYGSYSLVV